MLESGRGGRIINIASDAGVVALKDHIAYSASKAGLISVTRTLALEWGPYGITTNAVSPCVVMTPMSKAYWVGEKAEKHLAQIPVGRFLADTGAADDDAGVAHIARGDEAVHEAAEDDDVEGVAEEVFGGGDGDGRCG